LALPAFANDALPRAAAFDHVAVALDSEPDINPGMAPLQVLARAAAALAASGAVGRGRVEGAVAEHGLPLLRETLTGTSEARGGWAKPLVIGAYGEQFASRTAANFAGIWANTTEEVVYFRTATDGAGTPLRGERHYTATFAADALPAAQARFFWSVIGVDGVAFKVPPNPLNRFLLNSQSPLQRQANGALTLGFGPTRPLGVPEPNWLPTPEGIAMNLTFRVYGPSRAVLDGTWYPAPLVAVA
ncbi:MAG: DUF1214 domain-containing protein, partial [Novosphingobium sp.]